MQCFLHPYGLEDYAVACSHFYVQPCIRWNSSSTAFISKPPKISCLSRVSIKWLESLRGQALKFCPAKRLACSIFHQRQLKAYLQSGPVQCSDHWNLSGVLQLMFNLSPKSPQGTKVPLSSSLEFRRLYLLFASDTCILSSDDGFGEINGCQWAVGKRALTFPNPNPQNATGVQPSAFGGFGTHVPGTTLQSVVSKLHLHFSRFFKDRSREFNAQWVFEDVLLHEIKAFLPDFGCCKNHLLRSLKLARNPPIDVQCFCTVSCSLVPFHCSTVQKRPFIK